VTTVARTLLDLAAILDSHDVERAIEQAEALRLADTTPWPLSSRATPAAAEPVTQGDRPKGGTGGGHHSQRSGGVGLGRRQPPLAEKADEPVWLEQRLVVQLVTGASTWRAGCRVTSWDVEEQPDRREAELFGLLSVAREGPRRPAKAA
jgi:hypothetical protein